MIFSKKFHIILIISLLFSVSFDLSAQTAKLESKFNEGAIGDIFEINLIVESSTSDFIFPGIKTNNDKLELIQINSLDSVKNGDITVYNQKFLIIALDTGELELKQFEIKFADYSIYSNSLKLKIKSNGADSLKDIRDIKPPLSAPESGESSYAKDIIAGIVLLIMGLALFYFLHKRRKKKSTSSDINAPISVLILAELNSLKQNFDFKNGNYKNLFVKISDLLKLFIETEFSFPAKNMLTSELLEEYERIAKDEFSANQLKIILELSDLVKFAKYKPSVDSAQSALNDSIEFIENRVQLKQNQQKLLDLGE